MATADVLPWKLEVPKTHCVITGGFGECVSKDRQPDSVQYQPSGACQVRGDAMLPGGQGQGSHGRGEPSGVESDGSLMVAENVQHQFPLGTASALIMSSRSADSFDQRVADLGDVTPAANFAHRQNGNYFLPADVTVFNDPSKDTPAGGAGRDWLFADAADKIQGMTKLDDLTVFS